MTARKAFIGLALLTVALVALTFGMRALPRPKPEPVTPLDVDATPTMTASADAPRSSDAALWWRVATPQGPALLVTTF
jgi:hypothetical protein